jgi:hypothetical protein
MTLSIIKLRLTKKKIMKKMFTLCSALFIGFAAFSQVVHNAPGITVSPEGTNGEADITVTLDMSAICSPAGKEMDGTWPSIGFHSGAVVAGAGWVNAVAFDAANTVRFTGNGAGIFTATFNPRNYYLVDAGTAIEGFSFVFNGSQNTAGDWDSEAKAFNEALECADFFYLFSSEASINENSLAANLKVSPNPVEDVVTFNVDANDFEISITDITGKVVKTSKVSTINVSDLNVGTYIYTVRADGNIATGKLMKK